MASNDTINDSSAAITLDLSGFGRQLSEAEKALASFADGPAQAAAARIESVFAQAAGGIERQLRRAARSGEIDFGRLAGSLVSDVAYHAVSGLAGGLRASPLQESAGRAVGQAGHSGGLGLTNLTVNFAAGSEPRAVLGSVNQIAAAVAQAAIRGGRFL